MSLIKILKLVMRQTAYMRSIKQRTSEEISTSIKNLMKPSANTTSTHKAQLGTESRFRKFFDSNFTDFKDGGNNEKWDLLEQLCQRKGLGYRDIGSIARYDNDTVRFLNELPDEKLLKLKDFLRMRDPHFEHWQPVEDKSLRALAEMEQSQLDFAKKYFQLKNRGHRVFTNEQIIALAKRGYNEQQINRLIYDGGLYGESIIESIVVKDLNIDKLIQEINQAKRVYGKDFGSAHVLHNSYNPSDFTLAIVERSSGKLKMRTFDKDFNVINNEEMFIEGIENGEYSLTRENAQAAKENPEIFRMLKRDKDTIIRLRRISQKGDLHSDVTLKANYAEVNKNPQTLFNKPQVIKEEISFVDKNGEQIVETMIPSEIEGVYKIVQKSPNGTVRVLGDARIDPKTGIKTITKNMESLNGTVTDKVITIQPNGNMNMRYIIEDANGNIRMNRQLIHTFISPTEAISKVNDNIYRITYSTDKISVLNSKSGKVTEINLQEILKDCTPEQKQEMMTVLKQMSGENLLHLNDKVKNFKVIDNILDSWACYAGQDMGIIATGGNQFISTHELYHLISQSLNVRNADKIIKIPNNVRDKILSTYKKELKLFLEHFPEAQRIHVNYFTDQFEPITSIEETIAEGGAILNSYNNIPLISIRTEYLERYFPETIAEIEAATAYKEAQTLEKLVSKNLDGCSKNKFPNNNSFPKTIFGKNIKDKTLKIA